MNRDAVRSKVKAAVRRGMGKVDSLDRIVARRDLRLNRTARLVEFYDRLRPLFSSVPPTPAGSLPAPEHVDEVEGAAVDSRAAQRFLADVVDGGDIDAALVGVVRTLLDANDIGRARSVAQVLQRSEHTRPVGDICQALVTLREPLAETAWQLFSRNDVAVAMRLAPVDYFHVAFRLDPQTARTTLARAVDGEFRVDLMPGVWLDLARSSFTVGAEDVAAGAADRAEAALGNVEQQRA
ncbi:MAG: hypothetical protein ACRDVG_10920 [Jatrophihabitantaceae bacterium]